MHRVFEAVHADLSERGGKGILDLRRQHGQPDLRLLLAGEQILKDEQLAEDRRGLGGRQRRIGLEQPLGGGQLLVHTVAQLMCQRHHVARSGLVVEQHVRMDRWHGRRAKRAPALAGPDRRVDPSPLEEQGRDVSHAPIEARVSIQDDRARLVPGIEPVSSRQRRIAIVVEQLIHAEQPPLEAIVAGNNVVTRRHCLDQCFNHAVVHLVRHVARRDPGGIFAQPVVRRLVGEDVVEDVGRRVVHDSQTGRQRLLRSTPLLAIGRIEAGQHLVAGQLLAIERVARAAVHLLEEAHPCIAAGHRLLGQDLLFRLAEHVRPKATHLLDPMSVALQAGVGKPRSRRLIGRGRQLQLHEDELLAQARAALGRFLEQRAVGRHAGIGRPG